MGPSEITERVVHWHLRVETYIKKIEAEREEEKESKVYKRNVIRAIAASSV